MLQKYTILYFKIHRYVQHIIRIHIACKLTMFSGVIISKNVNIFAHIVKSLAVVKLSYIVDSTCC